MSPGRRNLGPRDAPAPALPGCGCGSVVAAIGQSCLDTHNFQEPSVPGHLEPESGWGGSHSQAAESVGGSLTAIWAARCSAIALPAASASFGREPTQPVSGCGAAASLVRHRAFFRGGSGESLVLVHVHVPTRTRFSLPGDEGICRAWAWDLTC